jgi:hypothetical protein
MHLALSTTLCWYCRICVGEEIPSREVVPHVVARWPEAKGGAYLDWRACNFCFVSGYATSVRALRNACIARRLLPCAL